jgi:hypothetical protein
MTRSLVTTLFLCGPVALPAADDLRVMQLEQDVRNLRREVQLLTQQLAALQAQPVPPAGRSPSLPPSTTGSADGGLVATAWVDASKWERLRPGMAELEVIGLLGPPTSMRAQGDERVLLYALEIGTSGFLGGSVTLRDRSVAAVQKPVLR